MNRQTVVITGAGAGVGRATARAFAAQRARLGLIARGAERLEAAAAEVIERGGNALALPADVANPEAVEQAADTVERKFGPIDIWVNCAMATIFAPIADITPEEYRRATEVTYLGYVWGTMAALRRMRPRNHGTIVQVGSALAYRAIPLQSAYCGAKFAIRGFTDSLRSELMHENSNIRLTMVQMPALKTPQFDWARNKTGRRPQPVPPIFQPELAAEAILFAAKTGRREVWVGGSSVRAILANKLVPGLLDRYLARAGYDGQLTSEPVPRGYAGNLFSAVEGDEAAHGRFDARAHLTSPAFWLSRHRGLLLAGVAGLFVALVPTAVYGRRVARALPAR